MTPQEFEEYVALVVQNLKITENARVSRNRKFEGKRQSGRYEVDIAVEFNLEHMLDLLLIVECKNWKRPVDRPVVQKLAQTMDAISAHKAAIVSPVGFTREAVEVSRDLRIALWVVSFAEELPKINAVVLRTSGKQAEMKAKQLHDYNMRLRLLSLIHFTNPNDAVKLFSLVNAGEPTHYDDDRSRAVLAKRIRSKLGQDSYLTNLDIERTIRAVEFSHHLFDEYFGSGQSGVDPRTASAKVADLLLGGLGAIMKAKERSKGGKNRQI